MHEENSKGTQRPGGWRGLCPIRLGEMPHAYRGHQQLHEMRHNAARVYHDDHRFVMTSRGDLPNRGQSTEFPIRIPVDRCV